MCKLGVLFVVDEFMKRRDEFFENLAEGKNLRDYFVGSTFYIVVFSAIYGMTMGAYAGGLQVLYSAVKIPMLLLVSLCLTVPSYYVLYSLLGGRGTLGQTITLLLASFTIMSTVLIALVPVNLFFIITSEKSSTTYVFTVLLNIVIFALGGFFAIGYFITGAKKLYPSENWGPAFLLGSLVLMFVGTQLAWVLRPYFNFYPNFIRPIEGNFYTAVIRLILKTAGISGVLLSIYSSCKFMVTNSAR